MRKISFFGQHAFEEFGITNTETCGISCGLMVLDYFEKERPSKRRERELYMKYKIKGKENKGTLGGAVARILAEKGLLVKLVYSSENLLDNFDPDRLEKYYPEEFFNQLLEQHKRHIEIGRFGTQKDTDITSETIEKELFDGNLVILQCFIDGNADGIHEKVMHWILIYGIKEEEFLICDPLFGKTTITKEETENYMKTPFGKVYITAKEK